MRRVLIYILGVLSLALCLAMSPEERASFESFRQRAESGDAEAMYRMALLLETGYDSIPADSAASLAFLRSSARAGFAPACNYLGYLYSSGNRLKADADSAYYWIKLAADQGDAKACNNLAFMLLNPPAEASDSADVRNDSIAASYLRRAADAGLPQAIAMLADITLQGRGVKADTIAAIGLYEDAIGRHFPDAELKLLNLIGPSLRFYGSDASLREALRYLQLGASMIAVELLENIGPYDAAAPRAYALLGHAYSRGLGVPYDHHKANEYFARAAMLGNPSAQFIIAETLEIFPDALQSLLPADEAASFPTPDELRRMAANQGVTTAEQAQKALLRP